MKALLLISMLVQASSQPVGGAIGGKLTYADGRPAQGLIVIEPAPESASRAVEPTNRRFAFPDAQGNFRAANLPPGTYTLHVTIGDLVFYYPDAPDAAKATRVTVAASGVVDGVRFTLPPAAAGFRIAGRVIASPDAPALTGIGVTATSRMQTSTVDAIDADGNFEFLNLLPGAYSLTLTNVPGAEPLRVQVVDRDVFGAELTLPRLVAVNGTIAAEGPVARLPLTVAFNGRHRLTARAQPDGTFRTLLPPGRYSLRIDNLPGDLYAKAFGTPTIDLLEQPLQISANDRAVDIRLLLASSPGFAVSGHVVTTPAYPHTPQRVVLAQAVANTKFEAPVDADGSFRLSRVAPGRYFARAIMSEGVATPPASVEVSDKDVAGVELRVPRSTEVLGRVGVDGNGPPPKFSLLLARRTGQAPNPLDAEAAAFVAAPDRTESIESQMLVVDVRPLPDRTFRMTLPEGDYWTSVILPQGLSSAYFTRSIAYGQADLLSEPMHVDTAESAALDIGFGTTKANPWVRVGGRVRGLDPAKGPFRVSLESAATASIEAPVAADGAFEFHSVLHDNFYTARLLPIQRGATTPGIPVKDKDVSDVEIVVPGFREISGKVITEGRDAAPAFLLISSSNENSISATVKPDRLGLFRVQIPEGPVRIQVTALPLGYDVQSITYGLANLQNGEVNVADGPPAELRIVLSASGEAPKGDLRGRIAGFDFQRHGARLVLGGATQPSEFETSIHSDGTFELIGIPQGAYVPTLPDSSIPGALRPGAVVVSGSALAPIEIAAPKEGSAQIRQSDDPPGGTTLRGLGLERAAGAANEAAAIANLRTINTAQVTYLSAAKGQYGTIEDMIRSGLLDDRFTATVSGYRYFVTRLGAEYEAVAVPVSGGYAFYSAADAVVRYVLDESLAPAGRAGKPVQ